MAATNRFEDNKKQEWKMELTVGTVMDLKEEVDIDLDDVIKNPNRIASILAESPQKLVSMFYVVCKDQIEKLKLSPRDFAARFNRETIDKATEAFIAAILLFYPRTSAGNVLTEKLPAMLVKMDKLLVSKATEAVEKALSSMDGN